MSKCQLTGQAKETNESRVFQEGKHNNVAFEKEIGSLEMI